MISLLFEQVFMSFWQYLVMMLGLLVGFGYILHDIWGEK